MPLLLVLQYVMSSTAEEVVVLSFMLYSGQRTISDVIHDIRHIFSEDKWSREYNFDFCGVRVLPSENSGTFVDIYTSRNKKYKV